MDNKVGFPASDLRKPVICLADPHHHRTHMGGAELQLILLAREFVRSGFTVYYLSDDLKEPGVEDGIHVLPVVTTGDAKKAQSGFVNTVRRIGADILYQRGRKRYTGFLPALAAESDCRTIFATSMDIDCRAFKETPRVFTRALHDPRALLQVPVSMCADRRTLAGMRAASLVLAQSRSQQEALKKRLGIRSELMRNIHPVPVSDPSTKRRPPVVLWLANLKSWKRPAEFLRLVGALPDAGCTFLMAGRLDGDDRLRRSIHDLEARDGRFHYLGPVSSDRALELYQSASLFVNTSARNEGVPNAFIQAWLARTPVISREVDPDGMIEAHELGAVSGSFEGQVADVARFLEDETLRESVADRARAFAVENFDVKRQFPRLVGMIEELLASRTR